MKLGESVHRFRGFDADTFPHESLVWVFVEAVREQRRVLAEDFIASPSVTEEIDREVLGDRSQPACEVERGVSRECLSGLDERVLHDVPGARGIAVKDRPGATENVMVVLLVQQTERLLITFYRCPNEGIVCFMVVEDGHGTSREFLYQYSLCVKSGLRLK